MVSRWVVSITSEGKQAAHTGQRCCTPGGCASAWWTSLCSLLQDTPLHLSHSRLVHAVWWSTRCRAAARADGCLRPQSPQGWVLLMITEVDSQGRAGAGAAGALNVGGPGPTGLAGIEGTTAALPPQEAAILASEAMGSADFLTLPQEASCCARRAATCGTGAAGTFHVPAATVLGAGTGLAAAASVPSPTPNTSSRSTSSGSADSASQAESRAVAEGAGPKHGGADDAVALPGGT